MKVSKTYLLLTAILIALSFINITSYTYAQQKTEITSVNQLPRRSYTVKGTALELIEDKAQLNALCDQLITNIKADLEKYDIKDKSTLAGYYASLQTLYFYKGDYDKVLEYIPIIKDLEAKTADKLLTGTFYNAYIKAIKTTGKTSGDELKQAFEKFYGEIYSNLPYNEIKESVESSRGALSIQNKEVIIGAVQSGLQPLLDNSKGVVPEAVPLQLISLRNFFDHRFAVKDQTLNVLNRVYEANNKSVKKIDIWEERKLLLSKDTKLSPVVVAVWDSGVDMSVFPKENRFVNSKEEINGRDDDGNGFVDDVNGIAYNLVDYKKAVNVLDSPEGRLKTDVKILQKQTKGFLDLQSGIESSEVAELRKTMANLKREEVKDFQEEASFYSIFSHGTHVAGITAEGNPAVKVLAARMGWDYHLLPATPTIEKAKFTAQMYKDIVNYFKNNGVKVVNMSWRYNSANYEGAL
ncbi:MAG: S8 family serine peptidase, partial [Blastocatellia bacterium]|nr:S8 family serine peptidase [Blastocatellia bacterium]